MVKRNLSSPNKRESGKLSALFDMDQSVIQNYNQTLQRFLRYGWDLLGIMLIASALILLFALLGITTGALVTPISTFLTRWLGVGRYFLVIVLLVMGFNVVKWRKQSPGKIHIGRILALEFAAFLFLALLSIIKGSSVVEAQKGQDLGGIIGWGIAEIFRVGLGPTFGFVLILLLLFILLMVAFRLFSRLESFVTSRVSMDGIEPPADHGGELIETPVTITENDELRVKKKEKEKPEVWLPPEFRKTFDAPILADETPDQPLARSENLPPLALLPKGELFKPDKRSINLSAGLIEKTLDEFGIPAKVVGYRTGPTVTQFAVEPGYIDKADDERQKIRVSQISSLQRDLALALSAERLRIEAPVPGKSYVGIEIPNTSSSNVALRPLIESEAFFRVNSSLTLALGRDVSGKPVVADLASMPHLLIAGTTGSGKSVCITAITACLAMNNSPEDLRLAMIDPKRVELMRFNGLPHLMGKVETEIDRILGVLRWATAEMDYRYKLLEKARARNIDSYNKKMERQNKPQLPKIVVLIDELADLMLSAPDETEHTVIRLAQKSRAIGIHLILATQRPSTDVVTGLIKANFPTRISFTVASSVDSRVILDTGGAETLLGKGDMLFLHPELGLPIRAQGVIVTDKELERIIQWWQKKSNQQEKIENTDTDDLKQAPWEEKIGMQNEADEDETLIDEAIQLIKTEGHASASYFQRQLRIGYPRAARLVDQLEKMGILGPSQGGGKEREILIDTNGDIENE